MLSATHARATRIIRCVARLLWRRGGVRRVPFVASDNFVTNGLEAKRYSMKALYAALHVVCDHTDKHDT